MYKWTCSEWNLGVTLDHLDEAVEPKESFGPSGYDVSSRILFKALGSVIEFRMVQCGFGLSLLFRIHYTHVISGWSWLLVHHMAGRERKVETGLGLRAAFLFVCYFKTLQLHTTLGFLVWCLRPSVLVSDLGTVQKRVTWGVCWTCHSLGPSAAVWRSHRVWVEESTFLTSILNDSDAH